MRTYIGQQEVFGASEFEELALGFDAEGQLPEFLQELFLGTPGESALARIVRQEAASGVLADLEIEAPDLAAYVAVLLSATPLIQRSVIRRAVWGEAA